MNTIPASVVAAKWIIEYNDGPIAVDVNVRETEAGIGGTLLGAVRRSLTEVESILSAIERDRGDGAQPTQDMERALARNRLVQKDLIDFEQLLVSKGAVV